MKKYFLRCTQCTCRTPISTDEARAMAQVYRSARTISVGCPACGSTVEGESEDIEDIDQERLVRATAEPGYVWSAEEIKKVEG